MILAPPPGQSEPTFPAPARTFTGPAVVGFSTADCFRWIYQFFSWLTSRLLYPIVNVAQWVSYGFNWTWGWINMNGTYTFKFQEWLVLTAGVLWNARIRPVLGTLNDVAIGYRRYCLEVSDALLVQLRALVLGTVFSVLSAVGVSQTALQLLHDGMMAARGPFLRLADQLDLQLFALESRVSVASRAMVTKVNELVAWTNHVVHPSGVIRGDLLAWSLSSSIADVLRAILDATVDPNWQQRAAQIAASFKPSDYASTLAAFAAGDAQRTPEQVAALAAFVAGGAPGGGAGR